MAVVGDAGEGKTSILWRIASRLREEREGIVFFLKASSIRLETNAVHSGMVTADEVIEALAAKAGGPQPVFLLLDTLDLVVRDEAHRDAVLLLASRVESLGCQLLTTCRRQEFSLLIMGGIESLGREALPSFITFELGDYDEDEFREAVDLHVHRFYWDAEPGEAERQAAQLFAAVASGRPVRELCFRPLTLRMLFTLYAPHKIPPEIHTFRLYWEFWDARVKNDRRAGMPSIAAAITDLQKPAALIALAMLAEGRVEVEQPVLEQVLHRFGCAPDAIPMLVARDVLHRDEQGRIRFFHQTLFEHAAARGLQLAGTSVAEPFARGVLAQPNDLFAAPVVEQWLLLSLQEGLKRERTLADEIVCSLLESERINHQFSGIYVYAHAPVELPKASTALFGLLDAEARNSEVVKRYVALLPNRAFRANEAALMEVERIWARQDWNLTLQVFHFLERYAGERPLEVARFLDLNSKLRGKLCDSQQEHFLWEVWRVARRVGSAAPDWFWEVFVWMHHKQTKSSAKTDFLARLIELACDHASVVSVQQFRSFFAEEVPVRLQRRWKDLPTKAATAYGPAWAKLWELQGHPLSEVLMEIKQSSAFQFRFGLAGLAHFVSLSNDPECAAQVLASFDAESETSRRSQWLVVFWPALFRCFARRRDSASRILIAELACRIGVAAQAGEMSELQRLLRPIGDEDFPGVKKIPSDGGLLTTLFDTPAFANREIWSGLGPMRSHLGRCTLAGHPAARDFVELLAKGAAPGSPKEYRALLIQLANRRHDLREARWILLRLAFQWQDHESAADALESIIEAQESSDLSSQQHEQLRQLCGSQLRPRGDPRELAQLRLRLASIQHEWDALPSLQELLNEFSETANPKRFRLLLDLLELGYRRGIFSTQTLIRDEVPWTPPPHPKLVALWRESVAICLAEYPTPEAASVERAHALLLEPSAGLDRLRLFGRILEKATVLRVERALEMLDEFLTGPSVPELGRSATFALSHKLQVPIARLINACRPEQRRGMLRKALEMPVVFAASLVHLLCNVHYAEVRIDLESLAANPKADDFLRKILLKQTQNRSSEAHPEDYPAVAKFLSRG